MKQNIIFEDRNLLLIDPNSISVADIINNHININFYNELNKILFLGLDRELDLELDEEIENEIK
jgi:hypothetical protein